MWMTCSGCLGTGVQRTLGGMEILCESCLGKRGYDDRRSKPGGGEITLAPLAALVVGGYLWFQTKNWVLAIAGGLAAGWFSETKLGRLLCGIAALVLIAWLLKGLGVI